MGIVNGKNQYIVFFNKKITRCGEGEGNEERISGSFQDKILTIQIGNDSQMFRILTE